MNKRVIEDFLRRLTASEATAMQPLPRDSIVDRIQRQEGQIAALIVDLQRLESQHAAVVRELQGLQSCMGIEPMSTPTLPSPEPRANEPWGAFRWRGSGGRRGGGGRRSRDARDRRRDDNRRRYDDRDPSNCCCMQKWYKK